MTTLHDCPTIQCAAALLLLTSIPLFASAAVREVPGTYPTITQAIAAAEDGDTVRVAPATYTENIDLLGKEILLTSHYVAGGDWSVVEATIIDGSSPADPAAASTVSFHSGEGRDTVLHGFTITGGSGTEWVDPQYPTYTWRGGGGIFSFQASPTIRYSVITANQVVNPGDVDGAQGGGILCFGGDPLIHNTVITSNRADYGGGLVVDYSGTTVRNTIISNNTGGASFGGGGVWTIGAGSAPIVLENCTVVKNNSPTAAGALYVWSSTVTVRSSILWGNSQTVGGPVYTRNGGQMLASYSDVEEGWTGDGNIDADPAFTSPATFLLVAASPCIDAGDPDPAAQDPEDSAEPGFADWPAMGGLRNDMGAFGGPGAIFLGPDSALIFADGFESGDTSGWSTAG